MKARQTKFEILRILAMMMIIAMHYMTKGMSIPKLSEDMGIVNHLWWLLYAACNVAVNVYVLISGYFMIDAKWNIGKVIRLVAEVLFYSWIVPLCLGAVGVINLGSLDFTNILTILLPIEEEHYWFATSYVMLYLLSPILVAAVKNLEKKQLQTVIVALLIMFGGLKSINPYLIPWDKYGYDILWFICLFLVAGYIRVYGIGIYSNKKKSLVMYIAGVLVTWGICALCAVIVRATNNLEYYMDMTYAYNYVTVLWAAVSLFYVFIHIPEREYRCGKIINRIAACTFGVYLLHENVMIRGCWQTWLGIENANGQWWQIIHMILCVIVVFAIGVLVDLVRNGVFTAFIMLFGKGKNDR